MAGTLAGLRLHFSLNMWLRIDASNWMRCIDHRPGLNKSTLRVLGHSTASVDGMSDTCWTCHVAVPGIVRTPGHLNHSPARSE